MPWGSDTLGHLLRFDFIRRNIQADNWYPQIMPEWYMGMQLLRYYGPLPYYFLYLLEKVLGSPLAALHGFILFWTLWGGLSWLAFRRRLGTLPAILGGVVYILLPDLVRVTFSEGNLPRVMAAGLTPLLFLLTLALLKTGGTRAERMGFALLFALITLTHAMMAAIFAAALGLFGLVCWILGLCSRAHFLCLIIWTILGITAAAAWLLPSLTGGITELSSAAVSRGLTATDWLFFLNPLARLGNIEILYCGLVLLLAVVLNIFLPWTRSRLVLAAGGCGIFLALLVTPQLETLFTALPLSNLLWPVRFQGIAGMLLLFAFCSGLSAWWQKSPAFTLLITVLLLLDCGISTRLIFLRPLNQDLTLVTAKMTTLSGWREATLDESRLGSAASYLFSHNAGREQVFGWGYQGARTAQNVASLNEALANGSLGYLLDRLTLFGVDDLVLENSLLHASQLETRLPGAGFELAERSGNLVYFHRDGQPRALSPSWKALGIGRGAQIYTNLFPQLVLGKSQFLEDYSRAEITRYPILILSGFQWRNRLKAEEMVRQAASSGVRVFVDLTGIPEDPLSHIPRFLDVWGEPLILSVEPLDVIGWKEALRLGAFGSESEPWHTFIPQNLQSEVLTFNYLGKQAVLAGYNTYDAGQVWFIGANLAYHALLDDDPQAVKLLGEITGLPPGQETAYQTTPLTDYRADSAGYSFSLVLDQPRELVFPSARLDGTVLRIDGVEVTVQTCENLVCFSAPSGSHTVEILYRPTQIYRIGWIVSLVSCLAILIMILPIQSLKQHEI